MIPLERNEIATAIMCLIPCISFKTLCLAVSKSNISACTSKRFITRHCHFVKIFYTCKYYFYFSDNILPVVRLNGSHLCCNTYNFSFNRNTYVPICLFIADVLHIFLLSAVTSVCVYTYVHIPAK